MFRIFGTLIRMALALAAGASAGGARADTVYATGFNTGELIIYQSSDPAGTRSVLSGSNSLVKPGPVVVGPDGNLYIGENGNGGDFAPRISKFEISTSTLSTVWAFGDFQLFPGSLVFRGNDLLVGRNPLFGNTGPVLKIANAAGGGPVTTADYTSGATLASSPGMALASNGTLYVSDQTYDFNTGVAAGPVLGFDAAGIFLGTVVASGTDGLAGPGGLALSGSTLYTASLMGGTVLKTDLDAGTTSPFASAGIPFETAALAILSDGGLLAASSHGTGDIYRFGTDGTLLETYASGLGPIGGIATVPEPETAWLAAIGLAGLALILRRQSVR